MNINLSTWNTSEQDTKRITTKKELQEAKCFSEEIYPSSHFFCCLRKFHLSMAATVRNLYNLFDLEPGPFYELLFTLKFIVLRELFPLSPPFYRLTMCELFGLFKL